MTERNPDVVIIGAGPIGASAALGLAQSGLEVVLADARPPTPQVRSDGRNFAIVAGSWRLLTRLGVTDELAAACEPLWGLEAIDGGRHWLGRPRLRFTARDLEGADPDEPLGQMVRAEALQAALDSKVARQENLSVMAPARFLTLQPEEGSVAVHFETGDRLSTGLVLGADGINSAVRSALNIRTEGRDYQQSVFTANVKLSEPHHGIARQLFTPEGPFATLPLPDNCANLAWYLKRGAAETLADLPREQAEAELNLRFAEFAGPMRILSETGAYPLKLQLATEIIGPHAALLGDAARRVTPLAGQGLNQGFRDVAALIESAREAMYLGGAIGSAQMLAAYSQARRFEGSATALFLDGIDRLFSNDLAVPKVARSIGLQLAANFPPLRKTMTQHASASEPSVHALMDFL